MAERKAARIIKKVSRAVESGWMGEEDEGKGCDAWLDRAAMIPDKRCIC